MLNSEDLINKVKIYNKFLNPEKLNKAFDFAVKAHGNQKTNVDIILPHPRMSQRNFVLFPLYELDKAWTHPISGQPIKKLILLLSNRDIRSIKQI